MQSDAWRERVGQGGRLSSLSNSPTGRRDVMLQFCPCKCRYIYSRCMWVDISASSQCWQEGWKGLPLLQFHVRFCWRTTGQHSLHTQHALHFFSESDEGLPSVIEAFCSCAGLNLSRPSARCKGNSPVFTHTDPDVARAIWNSVLRLHHKKHWWVKNKIKPTQLAGG